MYQTERIKAFEMFLAGKSLRQISKELEISRSTIERWSSIDTWVYERQKIWFQRTKVVKEEAKHELFEASTEIFNLLKQAARESQAYMNGDIPKKARKFSTNDLLRLSMASLLAESASLERATRAINELEELKNESTRFCRSR